MRKVKTGVIGIGFIGQAHIEALRRLGYIDIVAIASSTQEQADKKAQELGIKKAYGKWEDLLNDQNIEVIHICTPNHLHYPIAKVALNKGIHVICEKPLALDSAEAKALIKIANENKLVNAVHFNLRYYPLVQQAHAMVKDGDIGKVISFSGTYLQDWLLYNIDYNWRVMSNKGGKSRAMADIGSHLLDLAEFISGTEIKALCSQTAIYHTTRKKSINNGKGYENISITTEDYASMLLEFDHGVRGNAMVSQIAAGNKNRLHFEINGSESSIRWDAENPNQLWIGKRDSPNEVIIKDPQLMTESVKHTASYPGGHAEGFPDTSKQLFQDVYSYLINEGHKKGLEPNFPTFSDGLREIILCEAVLRSAKEKKWVEVNAVEYNCRMN